MSDTIFMQSGVSAFTGEPFVEYRWGEMHTQFTPEEAIKHALGIIETAEAAISDGFVFKFTLETVGANASNAAKLLAHFREYREGKQPPPEIPESET